MQAEVDVAIAMAPVKSIYAHPDLKAVVLLTGDGDFNDMVKFMQETHNVKVYVATWSAGMNQDLKELATDVFYLDNIWGEFSDAQNNIVVMTNCEVLKQLGFSPLVAKVANDKFPETDQKD